MVCLDVEVDVLKCNDIVAGLDVGHSGSDAFDYTGTFVSQNDWESTLGIFPAECVGIRMAETIVVYADANFVRFRRRNLDFLDAQVFAGSPRHGGFASDSLATG